MKDYRRKIMIMDKLELLPNKVVRIGGATRQVYQYEIVYKDEFAQFLMHKAGVTEDKLKAYLSVMPQPKRYVTEDLRFCWLKEDLANLAHEIRLYFGTYSETMDVV